MPWELTSRFAFASQGRLMVNKHLSDKGKGRQPYRITLRTDRQMCSSVCWLPPPMLPVSIPQVPWRAVEAVVGSTPP